MVQLPKAAKFLSFSTEYAYHFCRTSKNAG